MARLIAWLNGFGPCALCGAIAGALTGFIFGLAQWGIPGNRLSIYVGVNVGITLGLLAFLAIVLFIGVLGNFGVQRLVWPALFTSILVSVLVVLIVNWINAQVFGTLLGWIVGLIVGRALCYACARAVQVAER